MHRRLRSFLAAFAAVLCAVLAAPAFAQEYKTNTLTAASAYETPPATGTTAIVMSQDYGEFVTLPFEFAYFGVSYPNVWVSSHAFIQFGASSTLGGSTEYANTTWPPSGNDRNGVPLDGMVACLWDDLNPDISSGGGGGRVVHWTAGTAPNRRWIVSWEGVPQYQQATNTSTGSVTCQIKLYEGTGKIVFGYKADSNPSTWLSLSYSAGLCAVKGTINDTRSFPGGIVQRGFPYYDYITSNSSTLSGHPPRDVEFDPATSGSVGSTYTYSGTLLYDRISSTSAGIGATAPVTNQPVANCAVELRRSDGSLGFRTTTDANGAFSIKSIGADKSKTGTLVVLASTPACTVRTASGASATAYTFRSSVAFNAALSLGNVAITATQDATGDGRAPLHIARTIQSAYDWVATRTSKTVPRVDVYYDPASTAATSFTYSQDTNAAVIRIGSRLATNPDAWDQGVIRRAYGRHVLASVSAAPATPVDSRFDWITDDANAFAEAFGCWLHAAVTRETSIQDGTGASAGTSTDLETPSLTKRAGPDVAGWVAGMLQDLVDGANESHDTIDGAGTAADRVLSVCATHTTAPTASSFLSAWGAAGHAGLPLSRSYIFHGLVADDASESNDSATEAAPCGPAGWRRDARVLNLYNEDWYEFTLAAPASRIHADVNFPRTGNDAIVTLQILDAAGAVLATGAAQGQFGPYRAQTNAVAAGTYRVRIRHDSGPRLGDYTVQAYVPLAAGTDPWNPWTANRPLTVALQAAGGVPPYTVTVEPPYQKPDGMTIDSALMRLTGTPLTPGTTYFVLTTTDSGSPANVMNVGVSFTVNAPLDVRPGSYTPFALGRVVERPVTRVGGTDPVVWSFTSGELPEGITFDAATGTYRGEPAAPGFTRYRVDATDRSGSSDGAEATAVACVPFDGKTAAMTLAEGASVCGFWFDAVDASTAAVTVSVAKGAPKRAFTARVVGADGADVPATVKVAAGKVSISRVACPRSGRYYCIVSSDEGPATQLTGVVRTAPPKAGRGKLGTFVPGDTHGVEIGALAGAKVTFSVTPDKKSGGKVLVVSLLDPDGNPADLRALGTVTAVKNGGKAVLTLPRAGTWTVIFAGQAGAESASVAYTYTIAQTKTAYDAGTGAAE